ncbi:hypothetical protein [Catenulispora subtropica]
MPAAQKYDLRHTDVRDVLDQVERILDLRLDPETMVRKRRTIGAASGTGTWVRIELRGVERMAGPVTGQGWGVEAALAITGVPRPHWFRGASWCGEPLRPNTVWRVDEIEYITDGQPLRADHGQFPAAETLPGAWWDALSKSLATLAATDTSRLATPDTQPVTAARIESEIREVFPEVGDLRTASWEWTTAHADLGWANLFGPRLWITDWEDWGRAPRGLDAANLWANSLGYPLLAAQVADHFEADLSSLTGQIMALWRTAQIASWGDTFASACGPAKVEAARIAREIA